MTREAHLQYCKICTHQKKDFRMGLVCGLSGRIASFKETCESFEADGQPRPGREEQPMTRGVGDRTASQGKRLANYLIDQVVLIGLALLFGIALGLVLVYLFPDYAYLLDEDNRLVEYLIGLALGVLYYSFFEGFTGRSLGKFFTRTKVVTEDGERPDFKIIFLRSLYRQIPFNALSFLGAETIGWHDRFSGTRVIEID